MLPLFASLWCTHALAAKVPRIGGYAMGEHRGLRNVVSSALRRQPSEEGASLSPQKLLAGRHLDLDASARRQEIHENELRDMISDGRAMDTPPALFPLSVLWNKPGVLLPVSVRKLSLEVPGVLSGAVQWNLCLTQPG